MNEETTYLDDGAELSADEFFGDEEIADEEETVQAEESGSQEAEEAPAEEAAEGQPEAEQQEEPLFDLDDGQQVRKLTRGELDDLARKGLSADQQTARMRQQMDELATFRDANEAHMTDLEELAKAAGVDVPTYLAALQENVLVSKGMNRNDARIMVQQQRAQRKGDTEKAQQTRAEQRAAQERIDRDIQAFTNRYPGVKPADIPKTVWEAVRQGETLVNAYGQHRMQTLEAENKKLQEQLAAKEKNTSNRGKAVGSVRSEGAAKGADPFLSGFDLD